jgi:pyruvate,orthophosphate dikinase
LTARLMTYVYSLDYQHHLPISEVKALIGAKAAGLAVMAADLGLPVPPGFVITTVACGAFLSQGWPEGLDDEIGVQLHRIEDAVGRRFGDPVNPLLVSVRSGAPVSMPGMMDTVLNLGLNAETTVGLAAASGDAAFAQDCRGRLQQVFTKVVGVDTVPEEPWQQLRAAVKAVFRSWNSDRARRYRKREGIPDDLGTAVTVQAMVFGNLGASSGTGVLFTRNPSTGEPALYGEILFGAQGEDVVAGTHQTQDLSVLDERQPAVGKQLRQAATALERHFADLCDIEFTIERGKLWLLQVRPGKRSPQAALRIAFDMAQADDFPLSKEEAVRRVARHLVHPPAQWTGHRGDHQVLTTGLPASPGIAVGEIVTSPAAAESVAQAGRPLILVRAETSPQDVPAMALAAGVLTSRGGLTSHAAVVARAWGIPAVVGVSELEVGSSAVMIGGQTLKVGETLAIDGSTGEIFAGRIKGESVVVPEAATMLAWAGDLGIEIAGPAVETDAPASATGPTEGHLIRTLAIKGFATPDALASAVLSTPALVRPPLDDLLGNGLIVSGAEGLRLTDAGKARGQDMLETDRNRWGAAAAVAALDDFLALDHVVKETVTAWQLRDTSGQPVLNDHADAAYDARVLDRLSGVHADVTRWLTPLADQLSRLATYSTRLGRALEAARAGDQRFVASSKVDSYHGVWFELHEDLIRLAGRNRADEVAAGRA